MAPRLFPLGGGPRRTRALVGHGRRSPDRARRRLTADTPRRRLLPRGRRPPLLRPRNASNGQRTSPTHSLTRNPPQLNSLTNMNDQNVKKNTHETDPLPHRTDRYHRPAKDGALLRAAAKGQGHGGLLRRAAADPAAVAAGRLPGRAVRHPGAVWRLPRHHRRLRPQPARRRALHRHGRRPDGPRRQPAQR